MFLLSFFFISGTAVKFEFIFGGTCCLKGLPSNDLLAFIECNKRLFYGLVYMSKFYALKIFRHDTTGIKHEYLLIRKQFIFA